VRAARVLWAPWPYRAGFCITDDTDAATLASVRAVYDALHSLGLKPTKTVWPFEPEEPCGIPATPPSTLRGVTLADPAYRAYCAELAARGVEIALHGASAGNNRRDRTVAAFRMLESEFGNEGTFICHSKNADNVYWEEKVAPNAVLRRLLTLYSRHRCFGEIDGSPYFWGDVCREKVRWIRLFRTRQTDTLAADPTMPYYEPGKPYVRGWFTATKRSFHDCTTHEALDRLAAGHGLTVLYQYLHRYADGDTVDATFRADAERLAGDGRILVDTTARMMGRLKAMQGVLVGVRAGNRSTEAWLFNLTSTAIDDVQVLLPDGVSCSASEDIAQQRGAYLRVPRLPAGAALRLPFDQPVRFEGPGATTLDRAGHARAAVGLATAYLNSGEAPWRAGLLVVPAGACRLMPDTGWEDDPPLSVASQAHRVRLFLGQMTIVARELALRRRALDPEKFLGAATIPLEDHANW
jgi:hypothetical protein